jgi:hypothetical protein
VIINLTAGFNVVSLGDTPNSGIKIYTSRRTNEVGQGAISSPQAYASSEKYNVFPVSEEFLYYAY